MLTALAALAIAPAAYTLPPGTADTYYVRIGLDGFLPLLGGKEGNAQVDMTVSVAGLPPGSDGNPRASSDITAFRLMFNGQEFPIELDSVKNYFPKNTVSFTPLGHVVANDAPTTALPVRLPGLDPKRFPDITYLPIEFPDGGVEEGKSWTFKKPFDGVDMEYTVTPTKVDDSEIEMKIGLSQHDSYFEDEAHGLVASEKDAESKVDTTVTGEGTATFDRKRNLMQAVAVKMDSESDVTDLHTKATSHRKLQTSLDVSLEKPLPLVFRARASRQNQGLLDLLGNKIQQSGPVQRALVAAELMHPGDRLRRAAEPLVRSAVNGIEIPSQVSVRGQLDQLAVSARQAAARVPELINIDRIQSFGSTLSSVPSIVAAHWRPNYEGLNGLAQQLVQYISPDDPGPAQAAWQSGRKDQHDTSLSARRIEVRRQVRHVQEHRRQQSRLHRHHR